MGFYKNYRDMRSDVRRYNAAVRRANNLAGKGSSQHHTHRNRIRNRTIYDG